MRILVLGGAGMLGHKIVQRLTARGCDVWWTLHGPANDPALAGIPELTGDRAIPHFDATRPEAVRETFRAVRPAVVINCVGIVKQRRQAVEPLPSIGINALLPHQLAAELQSSGARLVHVSTDCVFRGDRGMYADDDLPDATDLYGVTKALGEVRAPFALTLRTSIIGRELRYHQSLLDWFLAQNGRTVRGYRRVIWSGLSSIYFAELIDDIIHRHPSLSGIYNVSTAPISKYALLTLLRDAYAVDIDIEPDDAVCRDLSLDSTGFSRATGYVAPRWPHLVEQLAADATVYPRLAARRPTGTTAG